MTTIGSSAFYNCLKLESVILPESVTNVGGFRSCVNLKTATLKGVEYIQTSGFSDCSSLKWIDLGSRLSKIDQSAFRNCSSLVYLVIPSTLSWIYGSSVGTPFEGCDLLRDVIFLGDTAFRFFGNATLYTRKDFITWESNSFDYNGSAPSYSYKNNVPAGFKPSNEDSWPELEKNAGTYSTNITMTFANDDMSFDVEISCSYKINPITLKAKVKDATREYGNDNPQFVTEYSGFVNNEDESVISDKGKYTTTASKKSDIGTYDVTLSDCKATNYVFEYEKGTLTVTKALLAAFVKKTTKVYGDENPAFSIEYTGLKNEETAPVWTTAPTIGTEATKKSSVGVYTVSASNGVPKNYELEEIVSGTLSITSAPLTIKAKTYIRKEDEEDPEFTLTYEGFKNDETNEVLTKQPTVTTTATKDSEPGEYEVIVSGAEAENYTISYVNGILKVIEADPLTSEDIITISSAGQTTWCSKYALDFTDVVGLKAYTATGYDSETGVIWLTRVFKVPARTGILLIGTPDEYKVPHKSTVTYYANLMVGTVKAKTINETEGDYTNYYLSNGDSGVGFYKVNGSVDLKANRAYLPLLKGTTQAGTRFIGLGFEDDGTTNLTPALSKGEGEGEWYTLQGQRVAKPGKGIYIRNGKKVVIK